MNIENKIKTIFDKQILSKFKTIDKNIISIEKDERDLKNFEFQWIKFSKTQSDSSINQNLTENRLYKYTKWDKKSLRNSIVLEIGSGAGRYTEILKESGAFIITVEPTKAIFENYKNNFSERVFFIKSSLFEIPIKIQSIDFILCYGVIQHLKSPEEGYFHLLSFLKIGGCLSVDHYRKLYLPHAFYHPKYLWRPLTKRLNPETLFKIINFYMPKYIKFDTFFRRLKFGHTICGLIPIPCWNYINYNLTDDQRLEWAILDTFDALGSKYDHPWSKKKLLNFAKKLNVQKYECDYGLNGLVLNLKR